MKSLRNVMLLGLAAASIAACKEKPAETPPPAVEAPKPPPPPPPPAAEPRAEKECAAPVEIAPATQLKIGERSAELAGYKLTFKDPSPNGQIVFGVLGPTNEDSGTNLVN